MTPKRHAVPGGKIRTVALSLPAFAAVRNPAETFIRRLRLPTLLALTFAAVRSLAETSLRRLRPPAPAAVRPAFRSRALLRFHPVRRPSGAVSQRSFQAAAVAKILSAFQGLASRSAVAFSLPTHECCASNPSRASTIYPRYPQAPPERWISVTERSWSALRHRRNRVTGRGRRAISSAVIGLSAPRGATGEH